GEEQLLGATGVSYAVARLAWIGRLASNVEVAYVWHTARVKTVDDLRRTEATFAGTGPASLVYPRLLNAIAGMKWKVVSGYNTTAVAHLAMQRGEVDGATSSLNTIKTTQRDWLERDLIRLLVAFAPARRSDFAQVPAVVELGGTQGGKGGLGFYANSGAVGRARLGPPGVATHPGGVLRSRFSATVYG